MTRQELQDSKPTRDKFLTDEEFEEARTSWETRVGRLLSQTSPSAGFQWTRPLSRLTTSPPKPTR